MFKFLTLEQDFFGLDINDLSLKIVKLNKKSNDFVLTSYNEARINPDIIDNGIITDEVALAKIIKSCFENVKGKKINTKYVIASLPEERSFSQVIQMPKMSRKELEIAVPLEAENYIPLPIGDVYLDFQVIPSSKDYLNNSEVLIVAVPKKIVDSYISCFKMAGLVPIVLEVESQAIARALAKKENNSLLVLIDFGESNTDFIVFSGNSIRFTCSLPISSGLLTSAISKSLNVDLPEAEKLKIEYGLEKGSAKAEKIYQAILPTLEDLTDQIKKYLNFYKDHSSFEYLLENGKTEKILLCGGGSELKGFAEFISKKLNVKVELGDPLVNFSARKPKNIIKKNLISFTTAIGLAQRNANTEL